VHVAGRVRLRRPFIPPGGGRIGRGSTTRTTVGRSGRPITNQHDEDTALVTLARIADGHSYDDFLETIGDERPARPSPEDADPATHDWLDGTWRELLETEPGEEQTQDGLTLTPGSYALFCWGEAPGPDERSKVWPSTPLEVADSAEAR
jgi:hypothetical protein